MHFKNIMLNYKYSPFSAPRVEGCPQEYSQLTPDPSKMYFLEAESAHIFCIFQKPKRYPSSYRELAIINKSNF